MSACAKSLHGATHGMRLGLAVRGIIRTRTFAAFLAIPFASMLGDGFVGSFGE